MTAGRRFPSQAGNFRNIVRVTNIAVEIDSILLCGHLSFHVPDINSANLVNCRALYHIPTLGSPMLLRENDSIGEVFKDPHMACVHQRLKARSFQNRAFNRVLPIQ
jgi:hypothetical protein